VRLIKIFLGLGLLVALYSMWGHRQFVFDAYDQGGEATESAVQLRLSGLDLTIEPTPIPSSDLQLLEAPDTRSRVLTVGSNAGADYTPDPPDVPLRGGDASLSGTVNGPGGPVSGATVRIERHTADGVATRDVYTNAEGRWGITGLNGGRYRIRAWMPGAATMNHSEVFFLPADQGRNLDLAVRPVDFDPRMHFSSAGNIYEGLTGTVAVTIKERIVDADGYEVVRGVAGVGLSLTPRPGAGVTISPATVVTDASGVARFTVRCHRTGDFVAVGRLATPDVALPIAASVFALPGCIPVPPPPPPPPQVPPPVTPPAAPISPSSPNGGTN